MCIMSMVIDAGRDFPDDYWNRNTWSEYQRILTWLKKLDDDTGQTDCDEPTKKDWMKAVEEGVLAAMPITNNAKNQRGTVNLHKLKTLDKYFEAVLDGSKTFEVRSIEDRMFEIGDYLLLEEISPVDSTGGLYSEFTKTGRTATVEVLYILNTEDFCKKDFVIMSIRRV